MSRLSVEELASSLWNTGHAQWIPRWLSRVERVATPPDVLRYLGEFEVEGEDLLCSIVWTFCDEALTSVSVRPTRGRAALDVLLVRLGVDLSMLVPAGDGLFTIQVNGTRFDVDRLDGVVSLHEVST